MDAPESCEGLCLPPQPFSLRSFPSDPAGKKTPSPLGRAAPGAGSPAPACTARWQSCCWAGEGSGLQGEKPLLWHGSSRVLGLGTWHTESRTQGRFWHGVSCQCSSPEGAEWCVGGAVRRGDLQQDVLHCLLPTAAPAGAARPCVHPLAPNQCSTAVHSTWQPEMQNYEADRTIPIIDGLFRGASSPLHANK